MSAASTRYRSEVPDLLQAFESGKLIRPSSTVPNVVDVASAIFQWAEVEESPVTANSHPIIDAIGDTEHLVFVMFENRHLAYFRFFSWLFFLLNSLDFAHVLLMFLNFIEEA